MPQQDGFSSRVRLQLRVRDQLLPVAQVGPDSLILRQTHEIPPSTLAQLLISVDGREETHDILLPEGVKKGSTQAKFF